MKGALVANLTSYILWAVLLIVVVATALSGFRRKTDGGGDTYYNYYWYAFRRALALMVIGVIILSAVVFVPAGHRGVVFDQGGGVQAEELNEGLGLVVPFWQRASLMDVRTRVYVYESFVQSKDLQEITLPIAVNYHVDPLEANILYQTVGNKGVYEKTIIDPAVFQASTQAVGQVVAADIAVSRAEIADQIGKIITPVLAPHGVQVEFVAIKDAVFDPQFITAIKNKVIAREKAIEEENLIAAKEAEAKQAVAVAGGQAEAIRIVAVEQAKANDLIAASVDQRLIEWERTTRWNGILPETWLSSGDALDILFTLE
jgi:regulator of protease activity HflC (stomatin/prohibitin superfamily)